MPVDANMEDFRPSALLGRLVPIAKYAAVVLGAALLGLAPSCDGGSKPAPSGTGPGTSGPSGPTPGPGASQTEPARVQLDPATLQLITTPNRDLGMLQLMLALEGMHRAMEPNIRNRAVLADLAAAADTIAAITDDPVFAAYSAAPEFGRDRRRFEELRLAMRTAALETAAAARAGDLEKLFHGYEALDATCTGCHKRYGPLH